MSNEHKLGMIAGPIVLQDDGATYDLRVSPWCGPRGTLPNRISVVGHDAALMLLIEKNGIFNRLQEEEFAEKNRCVLLSGNGYPGRSFRDVIHRLHEQLRVPLYVLADNDPAGYEFFFLVSRGSARTGGRTASTSAIPGAAYIGLRVCDFESLGLKDLAAIALSEAERHQLLRLKSCPWLRSDVVWQREFDVMLERGFKVEMEALCTLSLSFMASSYLPARLSAGDHLLAPGADRI